MRPTDIIEVPINVIVDMLLNGEISVDELTDTQKKALPNDVRKKYSL